MDNKPYPCCRSTHCAVDCALELRKELDVDEIADIMIGTYLVGYKQCAVSDGCLYPKTVLDAKFSTPYAVAVAFLKGKVTMEEFTPEMVKNPQVQELLAKVDVREEKEFTLQYPGHWGCEMRVTIKDGSFHVYKVSDPSGSIARPLTREQSMEKARAFLQVAFPGHVQDVIGQIYGLKQVEKMPVFGI